MASWKQFCGDLENTSERTRTVPGSSRVPKFIMNPDSSFTKSSNEKLKLLMTIHFPGCKDEFNDNSEAHYHHTM